MGWEDMFTGLVDQHYQALYRFALSLTRSEPDAADLTQQTFLIWANKGYQLRDRDKAKFWLFRTLHRCFLLSRRTSARFVHHELEAVEEELPTFDPGMMDRIDSPAVLAALARVSPPYQAAVALFYLEQWSYNQIAEMLDIAVGTVKSRVSRGIAQLRELLTDRLAASQTGTLVAMPVGNSFGYENSYERRAPALISQGAHLKLKTETELCHC